MNGKNTVGLKHADVVGLVKASAGVVKMRIQLANPSSGSAAGAVGDATLWSSVRDEAERQLEANKERHATLTQVTCC